MSSPFSKVQSTSTSGKPSSVAEVLRGDMMMRDWRGHSEWMWRAIFYISKYGRTPADAVRKWTIAEIFRAMKAVNYFLEREAEELKKHTPRKKR